MLDSVPPLVVKFVLVVNCIVLGNLAIDVPICETFLSIMNFNPREFSVEEGGN